MNPQLFGYGQLQCPIRSEERHVWRKIHRRPLFSNGLSIDQTGPLLKHVTTPNFILGFVIPASATALAATSAIVEIAASKGTRQDRRPDVTEETEDCVRMAEVSCVL